jgi:hypothetical protein
MPGIIFGPPYADIDPVDPVDVLIDDIETESVKTGGIPETYPPL